MDDALGLCVVFVALVAFVVVVVVTMARLEPRPKGLMTEARPCESVECCNRGEVVVTGGRNRNEHVVKGWRGGGREESDRMVKQIGRCLYIRFS